MLAPKLDPEGHAVLPEGCIEILTEMDFMRHAADTNTKLLIRGEHLCAWAERYYAGRGIQVQFVISQVDLLIRICPSLNKAQAVEIWSQYGVKLGGSLDEMTQIDLLERIYPGPIWSAQPSLEHFADFLLWVWNNHPGELIQPLIKQQADVWEQNSPGAVRLPYELAANPTEALNILDSWLGITPSKTWQYLGAFPRPLPPALVDRALETWQQEMIRSEGRLYARLRERNLPYKLHRLAAHEAAQYYLSHPVLLTSSLAESLLPHLDAMTQEKLRRVVPADIPASFPQDGNRVLHWVAQEYLPYREWQIQVGDEKSGQLIADLAAQFAQWYLDIYPGMLLGGELHQQLGFHKISSLACNPGSEVTLIIILDGLNLIDARELGNRIRERIPGLQCQQSSSAFTPLPTVTDYCKPPLKTGVAPHLTKTAPIIGQEFSGRRSPSDQLNAAQPGQIFIWSMDEPDKTYHQIADPSITRRNVEGQLDNIVAKLEDVVSEVNPGLPLKIIITSDHGRLLTISARNIPVPEGMTSHGRAAWGKTSNQYPASGYMIQGNLVYLHAERFGLPNEVVMPLDESTFLTSDGKSGNEAYSHGGLYPEEVVIPWQEYVRYIVRPKLDAIVRGSGQSAARGTLELEVINSSLSPLWVETLEILAADQTLGTVKIDQEIGAHDKISAQIQVSWWPTVKQKPLLVGKLQALQVSENLRFHYECSVDLQVKEMYSTDTPDILAGLE